MYSATDSNGLQAVQLIRTVNVVDTTPPVITVTGDNPATVELGSTYTDAELQLLIFLCLLLSQQTSQMLMLILLVHIQLPIQLQITQVFNHKLQELFML